MGDGVSVGVPRDRTGFGAEGRGGGGFEPGGGGSAGFAVGFGGISKLAGVERPGESTLGLISGFAEGEGAPATLLARGESSSPINSPDCCFGSTGIAALTGRLAIETRRWAVSDEGGPWGGGR